MGNRFTARNERQLSARSRWFAKRSQAAGVLLSGWFFFWIVGIVTPCCVAFAGSPDDDHAMNQAMSAEEDAGHGGITTGPVHQNEDCPTVFSADAPLPSQVFMLPAVADYTPHLVAVGEAAPLLAAAEFSLPADLYHPSLPPRIYLRTLRLRI